MLRGEGHGAGGYQDTAQESGVQGYVLGCPEQITFEYLLLAVNCRSWATGRIPGRGSGVLAFLRHRW